MSTPNLIDFLVEVPENEISQVLVSASEQKSTLVFKLTEFSTPFQTTIDFFFDKRVILDKDVAHIKFDLEQDVSIKFNVGTEVYFVKTKLKRYVNRICFDKSSKIIQLKRRKEPRYVIPKTWKQTASIGKIPCQVHDISASGIRFECEDQSVTFKTHDLIKIQFKIHKRADISIGASVHFFLSRPNQSSFMGMGFKDVTDVHAERIKIIIDEIVRYQSVAKY